MKRSARVRASSTCTDHIQLGRGCCPRLQVHVHVHLRRSRRRPSHDPQVAQVRPHALARTSTSALVPLHGRDDTPGPARRAPRAPRW